VRCQPFLLLSLLLWFVGHAAAQAQPLLGLTAGAHRIEAEVAHTPQTRAQGLMHRREMAPDRGMLFVFPQKAQHCMWMKNTFLPLAVAFLDEGGRILNIEEMQPQTETRHCAIRPAYYALEMNAGWFAQRGVRVGDAIGGVERSPRPQ